MRKRTMNYVERRNLILRHLEKHSFATTETISEAVGSSPSTVRRDFSELADEGLVTRVHGGVQLVPQAPVPAASQSLSIHCETDLEKAKVAKKAATFVHENDCIFIGAGKTCNLFAHYIKDISYLTVVTTNLTSVMELTRSPNISIVQLGGEIHVGSDFVETLGSESEIDRIIGDFYFDKVFITVDGIDLTHGYTIKYRRQIPMYTRLLQASKDFFVFADSQKFDRRAFVPLFGMNQITNIIATSGIPTAYRQYYTESRKNLYLTD